MFFTTAQIVKSPYYTPYVAPTTIPTTSAPPLVISTPPTVVPADQISSVTGIDPAEVAAATYGKVIPIFVGGMPRLGCHIIYGPTFTTTSGVTYASFGVSFGMPALCDAAREIRELRLDGFKVWSLSEGYLIPGLTFRFYPGSDIQAADPLVIAAYPSAPVAHRGQCCVFIENLALTDFNLKVPFVSAVIADTQTCVISATGVSATNVDPTDGITLGYALELLAWSPYVGLGSPFGSNDPYEWTTETEFITDGISERIDALIVAEKVSFLELINRFARLHLWDIVQTDQLIAIERGTVAPDISLDLTSIIGSEDAPPILIERQPPSERPRELDYSYIDIDRDYEINTVTASRMSTPADATRSEGKDTISLPVVHTAAEALSWATLRRYKDELTRETISFTTSIVGYEIEPGDVLSVDAGFKTYLVRVLETLKGANWTNRIKSEPILRCAFAVGNAPLDGLACVTGAWSLSRNLLTVFAGDRYVAVSGAASRLVDQSGNGRHFDDGGATTRPTVATAGPNSRLAADFDGSNDYLDTATDLADFINADASYIIISCMIDAVTLTDADAEDNHCVVGDAGQKFGISVSATDTLTIYGYNNDGAVDEALKTQSLATALVLSLRHEAGTLYLRVNNGTDVEIASGNTSDLTGDLRLAMSASGLNANMKVWEITTFDCVPNLGTRDALEQNYMDWVGVEAAPGDVEDWTPAEVPQLQLWLKGDELVGSTGTNVASWPDASGNGFNFTQFDTGTMPSLAAGVLNGMNVVEFDQINQEYLAGPDFAAQGWTAGTLFYVCKAFHDPGRLTAGILPGSATGFGQHSFANHYPYTEGTIHDGNMSSFRKSVGNPIISLTNWTIIDTTSATNDWKYYINGTQFYTTPSNTVAFAPQAYVGITNLAVTGFYDGQIAEIIMYSGVLSQSDREKVEGYLAHKWGLTGQLPSSHPYKLLPP